MTKLFECIKGLADSENINIVVVQGDVVKFVSFEEGDIYVEGIKGWCYGLELNFTPRQFVTHFKSIN